VNDEVIVDMTEFSNSDLSEQSGKAVTVTQEIDDYTNVLFGKVEAIQSRQSTPIGEEKEKAFDNDVNTKWLTFNEFGKLDEEARGSVKDKGRTFQSEIEIPYIYLDYNSTNYSKPWLQYQFEEKTVITQYQITSANDENYRDPYSWRLLGSNNGKDFSELDYRGSEVFSKRLQTKTFNVNNSNAYLYYKLEVIDNLASSEAKEMSEIDKTSKQNGAKEAIKLWRKILSPFSNSEDANRKLGELRESLINNKTTPNSGIKNNLGILQIAEFKLGDRIVTTQSAHDFTQPGNTTVIQASTNNSPPGEDGSKAFDNNSNTKWLIRANTGWIQYDFKQPTAINRYTITSANDESNRDPKKWILQASNDGNKFDPLDTRSSQFFQNRGSKRINIGPRIIFIIEDITPCIEIITYEICKPVTKFQLNKETLNKITTIQISYFKYKHLTKLSWPTKCKFTKD
jgi:hypothetical protein